MTIDEPIMIYDGDCEFCRRQVERWKQVTRDFVQYAPYQEVAPRFPDIPAWELKRAVQFVETDGRVTSGAHAVFRALAYVPGRGAALWMYDHFPGFAAASEALYRAVARNRRWFSRLVPWF